MKIVKMLVLLFIVCLVGTTSYAATIDVLWYGGNTTYDSKISTFAAGAGAFDPAGNGSVDWNVTFWNTGDAMPVFSNYDVLVIGSPDNGFGTGMDPARLLTAGSQIDAARGTRTFLSGQDADWHVAYGGQTTADSAVGFLYDAVSWAGSGTGMGIVSLPDGWSGSGGLWWMDENSFLKDELSGYVQYYQEESVLIPGATAGYPVNEGLTSVGLSNWSTSAHLVFDKSIIGFTSINDAGSYNNGSGYAVTILTQSEAGGGTTGGGTKVPEPGTMLLLGAGLAGLVALKKRMK